MSPVTVLKTIIGSPSSANSSSMSRSKCGMPRTTSPLVTLLQKKREPSVEKNDNENILNKKFTDNSMPAASKTTEQLADKHSQIRSFFENKSEWSPQSKDSIDHFDDQRKVNNDVERVNITTQHHHHQPTQQHHQHHRIMDVINENVEHRSKINTKRKPWNPPHAIYSYKKYSNEPNKLEDYEPGMSSLVKHDPFAVFSNNPPVGKPGDLCKYTENKNGNRISIQKSRICREGLKSTPHHIYMKVQHGGDIPIAGLYSPPQLKPDVKLGMPRRHSDAGTTAQKPSTSNKLFSKPLTTCSSNRNLGGTFSPPDVNISLSAMLSCAEESVRDRKTRDEIIKARKKELKHVLKDLKEKKRLNEINENRLRRHTDNYRPQSKSPVVLDRYNFDDHDNRYRSIRQYMSTPTSPCQSTKRARVLYNFHAKNIKELTLHKDDIVFIWRAVDKNWYEGEHHGASGIFPANYVEVLADSLVDEAERLRGQLCIVKFDFNASFKGELTVQKGDIVKVLDVVDDNWLNVKTISYEKEDRLTDGDDGCKNSKAGLLPRTYIQSLHHANEKVETSLSPTNSSISCGLDLTFSPSSGSCRPNIPSDIYMTELGQINKNRSHDNSITTNFNVNSNKFRDCNNNNAKINENYLSDLKRVNINSPTFTPKQNFNNFKTLLIDQPIDWFSSNIQNNNNNNINNQTSNQLLSLDSITKQCTSPVLSFKSTSPSPRTKMVSLIDEIDFDSQLNAQQETNTQACKLLPHVECIAVDNYEPQDVDELALKQGDIVHVTEIFNDGWYIGISQRNKLFGTFPGNFVRKLK